MKIHTFTTTHTFSNTGRVLFYGNLGLFITLFNLRSLPNLWMQIPVLSSPQISDHFSNFGLSFMFMLALALSFLNYTKSVWKFVAACALLMIALNIITELFVTVENTKDTVDAFAGILGVLSGLLILVATQKYGLSKNTPS